jgi:N-carbamoyl-L-amino-acid hydrolase
MDDRRDALAAAAEVVLAVEDAGRSEAKSESVATSADITCHPGAINVVPGRAEVLVDIRGVDPTSMERLVEGISASCEMIASRRALDIHITILSRGVPTVLRESVIRRLEDVVRTLGHEPLLLPSGAGHDAQCLAGSADVGILFAPSVDGVSHSPGEFTRPEDVIESARALAAGWLALAAT